MRHTKPLLAAASLFLALGAAASTAEAAKPAPPGLKVVLRETARSFDLAPGEIGLVASLCLPGETALGGSQTGWSANANMIGGWLVFDGINSGWTFEYKNEGTETITVYAATGALCTAGTLTAG